MTCKNLLTYSNFIYINNVKIYLNSSLSCKSSHAIYVIFCPICPDIFYVGKSQTSVNIRFNKHRSDLNLPISFSTLPITKHLKLCSKKSFYFTLIYHNSSFNNFDLVSAENYFKLLIKPLLNFSCPIWFSCSIVLFHMTTL